MDKIANTVMVYERLRKNKYRIEIEDGTALEIQFRPEFYHHLAGYHYLTDLDDISDPPFGKTRFYRAIKTDKLKAR